MMRQLRESTKIIMIVVAVSFVGLMLFDWSMDLSGRGPGGSPTAVGVVNGREVPLEIYQRQYEALVEEAREEDPEASLGDERLEELQEEAWSRVVDATLLRAEAERRGIDVTDEEVVAYVRSTPPPEMRSSPAFQTEGRFDPAKYQAALDNPQLAPTWDLYAANLREELPLRKLQEQVLAGVAVTERELEEAYRASNEQIRAEVLFLDPAKLVADSAVEVSEEELREAYESRKDEAYRRKAAARVSAVAWQARTTAADTARIKAELDSLRVRALEGEEFEELARDYSQDPGSAERGGDLGLFPRGQMVPEFEAAAFSLPQDSLSEPFLSPFGWHLVQGGGVERDSAGVERAGARHILLRIEPSEETFAALEDSAAALGEQLAAAPDSFQQLAEAAGHEVETTPLFEQSPFVPGLGRVPEVSEWVFESPAGSVSEPIRSGASVYLVKVEERVPAGFVPFEQVRDELREELLFERKLEKVKGLQERATELVRERGLRGAAKELGLDVREVGPFTRAADLPGIGRGNAFIGAAFGLEPGQTGGPVELESGIYYLTVLERIPADMARLEEQRVALRQQLLGQKAQQAVTAWVQAMRERAEVEDYREEFLQTAEGDTLPPGPQAPPLF